MLPVPVRCDRKPELHSFLLIRPGGIGDAVLLAPAVRLLNKLYPKSHITILAERRNAGVFSLIRGVDDVLCYDSPRDLFRALLRVYDVVIDSEQWHRLSALVTRLVRSPVKVGFDTNERRRMFTHSVPYSHNDYEAASFMHLLGSLGIHEEPGGCDAPFLAVPEPAFDKVASLLKPLDSAPLVVIFPGASVPERRWSPHNFQAVARSLGANGYGIVVVGGQAEQAEGDLITGADGVNLAGLTTLAETAAVISHACLVVSGDSGVLHLAVGLDIPTISLFGPGIEHKWAPRGEKHVVLNLRLSCSPCTLFGTTPPCPHGVRCMQSITVVQVLEAADLLLISLFHASHSLTQV